MRLVLLLALLSPANLLAQSTSQRPDYPPTFADARTEIYKRVGDVELKLWLFEPPPPAKPANPAKPTARGENRPAIVFFFGGGWKSGSPAQFEQHCRYLAGHGMVAMTADYRVRERHNTLADKSVADAKSAIRWIRQNSDRLGIDPDRIVAAGGSAGGHLAACTAVIRGLDEPGERLDVSSEPNAIALFNPAVLLAPFDDVSLDEEKLDDIATRTGVPPERISPIHHVRRDLPPTIIFHGDADPTVPFVTVERYTKLALQAGNECELVSYRDAKHGFFNFGRDGEPGEFYPATLHRLHRFLRELGYIETEPSIAVPRGANVHLRSRFDNSRSTFEQTKLGTVAFLGGSITEMNGYRVMVERWLQERFPETEFQFVNAGISSTCSTTGAFRLSRDVLATDPDLLFVEFAVNDDQDAMHAPRECLRGMEGILRHARMHSPHMDVVVTHFVNPTMLETLQRGQTPTSSREHEAVAKHYGVSTVDLAHEVATRISGGGLTWKAYGGTHPGETGNRIAAEMVADLLATAWRTPLADGNEPAKHRLPKPIDPHSYFRGRLVDVSAADCDHHWKRDRPDWPTIQGAMRDRFKEEVLLWTDQVGAELELAFEGHTVGAYLLAGPDAGTVEVSIDGGPTREFDLYHRFSKGLHYPRTLLFDGDLDGGKHTLKLRVVKNRNGASSGHAVRILDFVVNEGDWED